VPETFTGGWVCQQCDCPGTPPEAQQRLVREGRRPSVAPILGDIPSDSSGSDYELIVGGVESTLRLPKDEPLQGGRGGSR
jgi:hypothetical protein